MFSVSLYTLPQRVIRLWNTRPDMQRKWSTFNLRSFEDVNYRVHHFYAPLSCEPCKKLFNSESEQEKHRCTPSPLRKPVTNTQIESPAPSSGKIAQVNIPPKSESVSNIVTVKSGPAKLASLAAAVKAVPAKPMATIPGPPRPHKCSDCGRGFRTMLGLSDHTKASHPPKRPRTVAGLSLTGGGLQKAKARASGELILMPLSRSESVLEQFSTCGSPFLGSDLDLRWCWQPGTVLAMSEKLSPHAIRYGHVEVYPEGAHNTTSHIVSYSSNRNTTQRRITAFADGDPLSAPLLPLMEAVARNRASKTSLKEEDTRLQEDIMDMMVRLARVRSDILETENRLDLACNAMSPIRLLPPEILQVIFLEAVGGNDTEQWHLPQSAPQTVLSQVCGEWRRLAFRLPHLWNRFLFDIGIPSHDNKHPLKRTLSYLEVWVKRSAPLPVSVCLRTQSHFPHNSDGPYYHTILQSISDRASSRIELIRVHADSPMLLMSSAWSQLLSVKRLELASSGRGNDLAGRITLPCTSFRGLWGLTSFYYDVSPASPFYFPVPFSNLTEMEVGENTEGIDTYALRYLLRCCPKLKKGRFFMAGGRGGFVLNGYISPAVLSSVDPHGRRLLDELEYLALNGQYFLLQTVLYNLETPKLQTLELRLRGTIVNDPIMESWRESFESLKSLRTLSISCGSIENLDDFKACLELLDNLRYLKYQAHYDSKLFQMLTIDEEADRPPLLPRLGKLSTWLWGMKDGEREDFWRMYNSRSNQVKQLGTGRQFVVDAFVDSTKLYSAEVPSTLRAENPSIEHTIRFHIVSPFTRM
ncbi:hypothetical protein NMY22_g9548 [Coprinellus aureogranulatus]|nr:hypothetical protein NMY22_g9548 [Coprinellus aureogranulatus]